jgi:hypothetical protein
VVGFETWYLLQCIYKVYNALKHMFINFACVCKCDRKLLYELPGSKEKLINLLVT